MVKRPGMYKWSSFNFKTEGRIDKLVDVDTMYMSLGRNLQERRKNYKKFVLEDISNEELILITKATEKSGVIGKGNFINKISKLFKRNVTIKKRGRPRKSL